MAAVAATQAASKSSASTPGQFVQSIVGMPVSVKLNSGVEYRGILACLDGFMNLALEQTEEFVEGQLTTKYGDCFIRGNNGKLSVQAANCVSSSYKFALCPSERSIVHKREKLKLSLPKCSRAF